MKSVKLVEMSLLNFKGIKNLKIKFDKTTAIRGANATGKSTIADAFMWTLFGKDTAGNSDTKFGIKTVDEDGNAIPKIDHEVTATLLIDGETVELRRCYMEDWVTPRGKAEPELKGHTTNYFYNGVPLKESEYKVKISALIEESLFKMLTNPLYFAGLDWTIQREMLLRIAGGVTLEEIAANKAEFAALLSQLSGKDLEEFKAEISARKKKIKDELDKIPTRIDEVTRTTPQALDFDVLEKEKERLTLALDEIDAAMKNKAEASRQLYEKLQATQKEINGLRTQQQDVVFKAKQAAQKEAYDKNSTHNDVQNKWDATKREYDNYVITSDGELNEITKKIKDNGDAIGDLQIKVAAKRQGWYDRNAEKYAESTEGLVCPIYKILCSDAQALNLAAESKQKARQAFEDNKNSDLEKMQNEGIGLNEKITEIKGNNETLQKQLNERTETVKTKKTEYTTELSRLQKHIEDNPIQEAKEINAEDLPEWAALEAQINELLPKLNTAPTDSNEELTAQKRNLTSELDEIKEKLALRKIIEDNNIRKKELLKQERDLAQQKADLEKQEFTAEELIKAQMNEVERRVNSKFRLVRFKMFTQQINGGEKPDCVIISKKKGVRFNDDNSAGKIQSGLDIIRTLSEFYEVSAPIFIDNRESVTEIPETGTQIINLIVDPTCTELTIL